ncbi:DUF4982 domain-containing protein [Pedobacter sp. SD-b]|uniref:DUF4982 domain-containing protein n=1 Tax=Pedobacter segetis TaxID=2793069 RepID=A0ABS1BN29_9SPHI|nr:glycoside hydrolase family 2 TIM barrel-domain containing protein [Pedobacter segetis]MBK0383604.1 DUF4982 domain-containing protein [Pedobacter segetis]
MLKIKFSVFLLLMALVANAQHLEFNFNDNWQFQKNPAKDLASLNSQQSNWKNVYVPHDWSFEEGITKNGTQGQGGGYHNGGIGWYKKDFNIKKDRLNKAVYLDFEGVYMNSEIWVNGNYLSKRPYGYISFRYEVSKYLKEGNNIIFVRADNEKEPSARWYHPCGIYAPVKMVIVNKTHIAPLGVTITTPKINNNLANVKSKILLENIDDLNDLSLQTNIIAPDGKIVAQQTQKLKSKQTEISLEVKQPKLWDTEHPDVYTLQTKVLKNNQVIDEVKNTFGIRTVEWKTATGFWLNGKNIKIRGVCEHYHGGPIGGAWTKPLLRWKLQKLKAMGINAIRTAHNPRPQMFFDLCDEMGIMVVDEIFDGWHKKAAEDYGKQAFADWWKRDMEEWINKDKNHPSIILHSLGNETEDPIAPQLVAYAHQLDPTRLVTSGASNSDDMDVIGVNGGSETQKFIETANFKKPFLSTEAPHTWQTRGYYRTQTWWRDGILKNTYPLPDLTKKEIFFYEWASPDKWNSKKNHFDSSYDNATVRISSRKSWELVRDLPWYAGNFRWTGFDYYGEAGLAHGGWPFRLFMGGAIDVAGFEKDLFYFYQSQWTVKPMVHILPDWSHPRMKKGTKIPVWVYSNTDEVELFLNGKSLGKDKPGTKAEEMQCDWMVPYEEGKLTAIAYKNGKQVAKEEIETVNYPTKLKNTVKVLPAEGGVKKYWMITSDGVNDKNQLYPYTENKVYYHLSPSLRLVSLENGDPVDSTNQVTANYRKMFMGKTLAIVQQTNNAQTESVVLASIIGDKKLYASKLISIYTEDLKLGAKAQKSKLEVYYTTNGDDPSTKGKLYKKAFEITDGTTVKAIVKQNHKIILSMSEKFGEQEGLFWGDENTKDPWKNRGVAFQAEDATLTGATKSADGRRFKGEGFITFNNNKEGSVKWYLENDGSEGSFDLSFKYANDDKKSKRPMVLWVNDKEVATLNFDNTGTWNPDWKTVSAKVWLNPGANYIELRTKGESGPNLDELIVE